MLSVFELSSGEGNTNNLVEICKEGDLGTEPKDGEVKFTMLKLLIVKACLDG